MDSQSENYQEKWDALYREYQARSERLDAERRMEYTDALDDIAAEASAAGDWTKARFEEFAAKADRKWQEYAISRQETSV